MRTTTRFFLFVLLALLVYPVIYYLWKSWALRKEARIGGWAVEN